jgi:hypothetical protein
MSQPRADYDTPWQGVLDSEISKQPQRGLEAAGHFFSRAVSADRRSAGCNRHLHSA